MYTAFFNFICLYVIDTGDTVLNNNGDLNLKQTCINNVKTTNL